MESLSARPSRMAIDSLLNPPTESEPPSTRIPSHRHYAPLTPTYSPLYPSSPNQYSYFSDSHSRHQPHHHHHHHHHSSYDLGQDHHSYRARSAESSPDAYHRDRYDSVSSSSSTTAPSSNHHHHQGGRRRPPRPKYEEEEMYFIWYHRVDLSQEWKEVRESFNRQFPSRQRRGFQGIQCKFYRFIKEKKCPTLREQRRMRDGEFMRQEASTGSFSNSGAPQFGVIEWMGVWYPWMREDREEVLRRRLSR